MVFVQIYAGSVGLPQYSTAEQVVELGRLTTTPTRLVTPVENGQSPTCKAGNYCVRLKFSKEGGTRAEAPWGSLGGGTRDGGGAPTGIYWGEPGWTSACCTGCSKERAGWSPTGLGTVWHLQGTAPSFRPGMMPLGAPLAAGWGVHEPPLRLLQQKFWTSNTATSTDPCHPQWPYP